MASFHPGFPPSISTPMPYGSRVLNFNMPRMHNLDITDTLIGVVVVMVMVRK